MTKFDVYNEATFKELSANPNGTKTDIVHRAMDEWAKIVSADKDKVIADLASEIGELHKEKQRLMGIIKEIYDGQEYADTWEQFKYDYCL